MEWHAVVNWVGRHKYLALASVFALVAGQEPEATWPLSMWPSGSLTLLASPR